MRKLKMLIVTVFMVFAMAVLSGCVTVAKMPVPSVKEGRFNFSVTYEINGDVKTYSGVYVCKYNGSYLSAFRDGGVDWIGYIENTNSESEIAIQRNEDGVIYIGLGFYPGYFMSDPDCVGYSAPEYTLYMTPHSDDPDNVIIDNDIDFIEKYGIRVLSYTYDKPIENSYEDQFTFGRVDWNIN